MAKLYRDTIEIPSTGSIYRVLSAEAYSKEGLNSSAVWADEGTLFLTALCMTLWRCQWELRGRKAHLTMITTAGRRSDSTGNDSICLHALPDWAREL
jgi:hypothetical protein